MLTLSSGLLAALRHKTNCWHLSTAMGTAWRKLQLFPEDRRPLVSPRWPGELDIRGPGRRAQVDGDRRGFPGINRVYL